MSPSIERQKGSEFEAKVEGKLCFVIDLKTNDRLDMGQFKRLFDSVKHDEPSLGIFRTKFIVTENEKMYVFSAGTGHYDFYNSLKNRKLVSKVLCAGDIRVVKDLPNMAPILGNSSVDLNREGIVSTAESDKYKTRKLAQILSPDIIVG